MPAASIKQRLKAASESSFGGMREGPAAEREPRGEAIDAVRAFFRDAGVEKALTPMDPIREMATNAGNAAAAVAAARERNARTTWAPMNDKGTLLDDEGDLEEEDVFILDVYTTIFVWIGSQANDKEKAAAATK